MIEQTERIEHEKAHGKKISHNAEAVWGWATPAGKLRAERRAKYLYELGQFNSSHQLLEIGCGTGLFTEKVSKATSASITAIDISDDLLEVARKKLPEVSFKIDDAMNLSFADESFNGVYGSSILHHLDMEKAIEEIYRVLKPEGRMVFAEPNMLNPQIMAQKNIPFIKKMMHESPDETAIVRWKMKKQLEKTGFKNARVFPYDFLHPATPSFMIPLVKSIGTIAEKILGLQEIAGSVIIYAEK
ncbi:MAG: hypothetical protein COA57_04190 [Flavobacteriales bacterium]|nr:MAG: hypothetical protein COA57_04190 [Flavobacteriales bacterium]